MTDAEQRKLNIIRDNVPRVYEAGHAKGYTEGFAAGENSGTDTSNDTVTPDAMREGFTAHDADGSEITGTIPDYDGGNTVEMTSPDGATLNTAGTYCEGNIEVVPKLQEKTATENGVVIPDDGYAGLEKVLVDVPADGYVITDYRYFCAGGVRLDFLEKFSTSHIKDFTGFFHSAGGLKTIPLIDTSNGASFHSMFYDCSALETIPLIDTSKGIFFTNTFIHCTSLETIPSIDTSSGMVFVNTFYNCIKLKTISLLNVSNASSFTNTFVNCNSLENLTMQGIIKGNGFNVSWSPLTHDSLMSIINALQDKTTDTSGTDWLIPIGSTNKAKLTEEELEIAYNKGWRVS